MMQLQVAKDFCFMLISSLTDKKLPGRNGIRFFLVPLAPELMTEELREEYLIK
jgi:hypothetical protein